MRHGDKVVWESNTIVRYLASYFSKDNWISSSEFDRSLQERWMDWSIEKLEPAFVKVFWGYFRTAPEQRNPSSIEQGVVECEQCMSQIAMQLSNHEFLLGDTPSVADIAVGVFMHRLWVIELEIKFPDTVHTWYESLSQRSAFQRWVMSDFRELEGRSEY